MAEANILGKLYATKAKKIDLSTSQDTKNSVALLSDKVYTYNLADLLENVKTDFNDIFSEDVYQKLGMQRFNNDFSKNLLFQDKSQESIYDIMGENDRLLKKNEKFKADIESFKERLKIKKTSNSRQLFQ